MPAEQKTIRKLRAILSADVKGYSLLMADNELATIATLKSYRQKMTILIQQHQGRVVDSPGDNILAEFASAVDAVKCAVKIQEELKERNAELSEDRKMQFRIGINIGDVVQDADRIYGDGVNVAARIEGLAEPGGICISRGVCDHVKKKLKLGFKYLGEHAVKNISEPVRVYKVLTSPEEVGRIVGERKAIPNHGRKFFFAASVMLILGITAAILWNLYFRPPLTEVASVEKMAFPLPDKPSIAVLPFNNMSDDPKQEYFSDGMSEDVITDLSKIPGLLVISRTSSFTYKGKSVKTQQIAEELGVRYVLEGSVRKAENRVRINAQLIDSTTGHHLWADRYDGDIRDIFTLQDEITHQIVTSLAVKLTEGEKERLANRETNSIEAYDAFLKGSHLTMRMNPDSYAEAVPWFEKAIELDPNYSRAYAALAETYHLGTFMGFQGKLGISYRQCRIRRVNYLQVALKNPTSIAHRDAAFMYAYQRQHEKAINHGMRAIALDPNDGKSLQNTAFCLLYVGRYDEAVDLAKKSQRVDPACLH